MFNKKSGLKGWMYLAPSLILLAIFTFYPLFNTVLIAFKEGYEGVYGTYDQIGIRNFLLIFQTVPLLGWISPLINDALGLAALPAVPDGFKYIFSNTFIIVFVTVPISTLLSLLIAVALNSIKKFQKFFQTVFFLPYVTNAIAIGLVFAVMFGDSTGIINAILEFFGFEKIAFLGVSSSRFSNLVVLCIYIIWNSLAMKILLLLSGLQSIDKQYYQAAQVDGTPKWRVFAKITVPLLSPTIFYVLITSFIGAFKEYSSIVGLFGDGANNGQIGTVVWFVYEYLSNNYTGIAAAASIILFGFIMIFTAINMVVSKKKVHY